MLRVRVPPPELPLPSGATESERSHGAGVMKIYVCYGTFKVPARPGGHPCGNAYHALVEAGHRPEVVRSYGLGLLPDALNQTAGRREVKRLTGNSWVPVL